MKIRFFRAFSFSLLLVLLSSCSDDGNLTLDQPKIFDPTKISINYTQTPISLANAQARFAKNVAYGADAQQAFDIFLPPSTQKTPLVIFVHGGSFSSGDKSDIYSSANDYGVFSRSGTMREQINFYMDNNIAFATINYRLLQEHDAIGVTKSLLDVQRCLQYIRFHAHALNIDKSRIILHGISAGAGSSLWVAFKHEGASAGSDPIARESTRVSAVIAQETQATYDLLSWIAGGVFNDYFGWVGVFFAPVLVDIILALIPSFSSQLLSFYAIPTSADLFSSTTAAYRAEVDILSYMSADDPEIWVANVEEPAVFPTSRTLFFHHPFHARLLKQRAAERGVTGVFYIPALNDADASNENLIQFVARKFNL